MPSPADETNSICDWLAEVKCHTSTNQVPLLPYWLWTCTVTYIKSNHSTVMLYQWTLQTFLCSGYKILTLMILLYYAFTTCGDHSRCRPTGLTLNLSIQQSKMKHNYMKAMQEKDVKSDYCPSLHTNQHRDWSQAIIT